MSDEIWPDRPKTENAGTASTEDVDLGCVATIRTPTRGPRDARQHPLDLRARNPSIQKQWKSNK
eukprot:7952836-Pyramimonas_sp.AAC.1